MKMFRYIALLAILVGAASCVQTDIDTPVINRGGQIQVVGRVQSFSDRNVDTRAFKVGDEGNTASMCLAVFDASGICKDKQFINSGNPTFTLDKNNLKNWGARYLYIFANIANPSSLGNGNTLDEFLALTSDVQGVDMPLYYNEQEGTNTRCFPMIGVMEINDVDAIESIIQIPLEAIYAKVVVNIISKPDQKVEGIDYASFSLTRYEVHNVVEKVDFKGGTISAKGKNDGDHDTTPVSTVVYTASNITSDFAQADKQASFYFYIPERFCKAKTAADEFDYPFGKIADLDEDEARRLPQCYKPMLAGAEGTYSDYNYNEENDIKATFVRFFGEYIDHQGHNWNVSYDIYVGNDNYSNFDIERNTQYNNYVTIKGISKSNDQGDKASISIDHRVNIERVNPIIINLRRETLLDSHFEVRPLRIRKNANFKGQDLSNAKVRVELVDPDKKWVGIERSFGMNNAGIKASDQSVYLQASDLPDGRKNAAGKRKYFTTDLTTTTLAGNTQIDLPVTDEDQTVWIYVDECTDAGDDVRSAAIRVTLSLDGTTFPIEQSTDFVINQRKLFPVTTTRTATTDGVSGDYTYYIEYHEEYLNNYDAEDSFGQTEWNGMEWGLADIQLSHITNTADLDYQSSGWDALLALLGWNHDKMVNTAFEKLDIKYDFYLYRDVKGTTLEGDGRDHNFSGYYFNSEIIAPYILSTYQSDQVEQEADNEPITIKPAKINKITLAQDPKSAFAYCYNKNKRNENGEVVQIDWYLPAIDEIEDIVESAHSRFEEFQGLMYWSCQSAYRNNILDLDQWEYALFSGWGDTGKQVKGSYYTDETTRARATKALRVWDDTIQDFKFVGAPSGADVYGTQYGEMRINNWNRQASSVLDGYPYVTNNISYDNYPGNLPRTGTKARVRCVRKVD
ncbi:MAG: DUF4906 domain-containing protein [Alistipes sp.]|nr:DUF4906 domain-containing protein [Alistipes sp.]